MPLMLPDQFATARPTFRPLAAADAKLIFESHRFEGNKGLVNEQSYA